MSIEQAALAALYPVLVTLCLICIIRFWPARRNLDGPLRALVSGILMILVGLTIESIYYGVTRFHPRFYDSFGWNVWLVGSMKLLYIGGTSLILSAYWKITETKPGAYTPLLTGVAMWLVVTAFVALM